MSELTRTPIPVSGYVEKVYFNTDLSVEEVDAILTAAYIKPGVMGIMESVLWSDSYSIDVFESGTGFAILLSSDPDEDPIAIFDSGEDSYYGVKGWNTNITYPLVINSNIEGNEKNEMLSNLCSITPFKDEPVIPEEPLTLDSFLKGIADAIRERKGTTKKINAKNYKSEIRSIDTGVDTSDATAVASDILKGKTAYVNGKKITGKIYTYTLEPPSISVNHGTIMATTKLQGGYYSRGSKTATMDLTTIYTTTYTPGRYDQTIAEDTYLAGDQIIKGDYNLVPENIKKNVSIFGVTGTYEGSGSSEDLSAEVSEYTNKIASLESVVASLETELANKASGGTGSGSLETCSLTLDFSARLNAASVFYHTLEDGEVIGKIAFMNPDLPILTIEVLCNYYIVFDYNGYNLPGFTCENAGGGAVGIGAGAKYKYKITAPNGGNAKITVYNND